MTYPYPGYTWGFGHCAGCRCFASTTTLTTTYVPRHRKPGPAH